MALFWLNRELYGSESSPGPRICQATPISAQRTRNPWLSGIWHENTESKTASNRISGLEESERQKNGSILAKQSYTALKALPHLGYAKPHPFRYKEPATLG